MIMFENFINQTINWATNETLINSIILIGSYVRGTQKADSDIDLVVVTSDKQHYIDNPSIFNYYGEIERSNIEFYGECTSVRIWYKSGLEVEFGIVTSMWVNKPLDHGTLQALTDGYRILIDKNELFLPITSIVPERTV